MLSAKYRVLLILSLFISCFAIAQPQPLRLEPIDNLFLNNNIHLERGLNCMVFTKQIDFNKTFGLAKTETNIIKVPNFDSVQVLMIALPADNHDAILTFISATRAGEVVEVYCKVQKKNYPLTYTAEHIAVVSIPRIKGVNTINFYEGNRKVKSVKMK